MKTRFLKVACLVTFLSMLPLLSGCGESAEDRQLAAGLNCLDEAKNTTDANVCLDKVSGLENEQSYLIRCSANFIAQGFTGRRVADAFQKLKDNPASGNTQTAAMAAYFVFSNASAYARHTAQITFDNCTRSGVKSMIGLATWTKLASTIAGVSIAGTNLDPNSPSFDPNALQAQLQAAFSSNNATTNQTVGELATTAQTVYCGDGSAYKNQDVCTKLDQAILTGGGNAQNVGRALLDLLTP